jgi:stage IV sporulation protein FB
MPKIKISFISVIWIFALIYYKPAFFSPMIIAIIIHELSHILAAFLLNIRIKSFTLMPFGARIESARELSYREELLFSAAGPLGGILSALLCLAFYRIFNDDHRLFSLALTSLALSIFNLIPISPLDGGRMVKCALFMLLPFKKAAFIIALLSFVCLFAIWLFSAYTLLKIASGLSMLVFCSIFFIKRFIFDTKNRDFESF